MIGLVAIIAVITFLGVKWYKSAFQRPAKNFPPGPPSLPIWGAYWIVLAREFNNLGGSIRKLALYYKTTVVGMYLGNFPTIVIDDPKLIREGLNNPDLDGRNDIFVARLRSYLKIFGIFFTDGYFWHVQRRFTFRNLRDFGFGRRAESLEAVIANDTKEMIDMVIYGPKNEHEKKIVNGDLIYLPHYFDAPSINGMMHIFTRTVFPRSEYKKIWDLGRMTMMFQRGTNDFGGSLSLTPWLKDVLPNYSGYKDLRKSSLYLLNFFTDIINDAKKNHDPSHDRHFIDTYLRQMNEERKKTERSTFSDDQFKLVLTDYMIPAASAFATVLTLLVERILHHPTVQDKIHEEIDRVVGRDRLPTLDDRKNMPYTEACIREVMRVETLVPLGIPHRAMKDVKLDGYDIPQNTIVTFNYPTLHNDKELWGDPENFRPERFIVNGQLDLSKDKSLPFGAGGRLCPGETFARQGMFQVFAGFMQAFTISTADGKPRKIEPKIQGLITNLPDFWIRVKPRNYAHSHS
ncbi:unnamed protein product, partial [Brenthis ino]